MVGEREIHLERMRWPEVRDALEGGWTTVVVPVGAVEQHGPHLPLCVDAERGTRLGEEVARRLGKALVAPTIRVGCSEHHMAFPGTLSVSPATLEAVCRDYCVSLGRHGFERICLLPSHGGNFAPLADMLDRLDEAAGDGCAVVAYTDLVGFVETWRRTAAGYSLEERVGGHADVAESSEMLAIRPELVRPELAEIGFADGFSRASIERILEDGLQSVTPNGILGDARGMSEELGRACLAATADVIARSFGSSSRP